MLMWMYDVTRLDIIRNEYIREEVWTWSGKLEKIDWDHLDMSWEVDNDDIVKKID